METGIVKERKNLKRNRIISTVRYGQEISRHDVKKLTGYSMTTVLSTIGELVEKGIFTEEECTTVRTGRPPTWLKIQADCLYAIGVEFNADRLNCAVVDFDYKVIYSDDTSIDPQDSAEVLVGKLTGAIHKAMKYLGDARSRVLGIGLGMPGWVDRTHGAALSYAHLPAWRDIPIRQVIEEEFGCRVLVENNINTMAIAYRWETYRQKAEDFVFFSLKYGIRMAMYINNRLFSGSGNAGEIGHVRLVNGTRFCSCGKYGCLDTEVSAKAIRQKIRERMDCGMFATYKKEVAGNSQLVTLDRFIEYAAAGDEDSMSLLQETASWLSPSLSMILGTLNPRRIIIASKSGMGGKLFSDMVTQALQEYSVPALLDNCTVECIQVPDLFGAQGAAMMVMEDELQVIDEAL